jgi:GxxExxY protein
MSNQQIEFELPDSIKSQMFTIRSKCSQVFTTLRKGYAESIYQRALGVEFQIDHIPHDMEVNIPIAYRGHEIGVIRADIILRGDPPIIIETKATYYPLRQEERWQLIRYMRQKHIEYGVLVNFPQIQGVTKPFLDVIVEYNDEFYNVDLDSGFAVLIQ